ncbi:hypothetical protein CYG48_09195 [Neorhizobium sp. SOG26]|jgi:hypothetical protein|uniref:Uncharacterized protein n=1 Tax=Neorhizobium turbinariae TaxID=2937795 RepID=A0ABT0IKT5_9HYPH|nr:MULTISPECIES: hypothetical protein [Neorhizobium]AXV15858.1 hypothetical protein CYG48_09195 [Neorhizobium sp. SOG26]MCK8778476.1 hypothetical protein [Neorhizobium turbinariae]
MTTSTMNGPTFAAMPPIGAEKANAAHPLKGVLITVFTVKIAVAAFLLATVSLAPPVNAEASYMTAAIVD